MNNALVWGANGGIGQAIISTLNNDGWTTIGVSRHSSEDVPIADYSFDTYLDDPSSLEQTIYKISQEVETINFWCYAAGDILSNKVSQLKKGDWDRIIAANLSGAYAAIHYSLPLLSDDAHIFFLGAVSERLRLPGLSAYAAAKAGLEAFVTAFSKEERNKYVTIVRPGAVATPLWDKVPLRLPADAAPPEKVAKKILDAYHAGHRGQLDLI